MFAPTGGGGGCWRPGITVHWLGAREGAREKVDPAMQRVLAAVVLAWLVAAGCSPAGGAPAGVRTVRLVARQFAFEPPEVRVKKGERVRLVVTSADVTHGLAILEYNINRQVPPGQEVAVEFTASREGTFTLFCTVFCGTDHAAHKGRLVVEP